MAPSEGRGATLDLGERGTLLMLPCSVMKRGATLDLGERGTLLMLPCSVVKIRANTSTLLDLGEVWRLYRCR